MVPQPPVGHRARAQHHRGATVNFVRQRPPRGGRIRVTGAVRAVRVRTGEADFDAL
jgi:hypothetical protein